MMGVAFTLYICMLEGPYRSELFHHTFFADVSMNTKAHKMNGERK